MKNTYSNAHFLFLLIISLLFFIQNFAQNNNKLTYNTISEINKNFDLNTSVRNTSPVIVLNEIEILLEKELQNQKINEAIEKNTFSELGNSFYNLYKSFNQSKEVIYPFVINVEERPIAGSMSSEICILVNDKLIYKFRALAKNNYLIAAAQESNKQLEKYFCKNTFIAEK